MGKGLNTLFAGAAIIGAGAAVNHWEAERFAPAERPADEVIVDGIEEKIQECGAIALDGFAIDPNETVGAANERLVALIDGCLNPAMQTNLETAKEHHPYPQVPVQIPTEG